MLVQTGQFFGRVGSAFPANRWESLAGCGKTLTWRQCKSSIGFADPRVNETLASITAIRQPVKRNKAPCPIQSASFCGMGGKPRTSDSLPAESRLFRRRSEEPPQSAYNDQNPAHVFKQR